MNPNYSLIDVINLGLMTFLPVLLAIIGMHLPEYNYRKRNGKIDKSKSFFENFFFPPIDV